jgi:hypothetical protein
MDFNIGPDVTAGKVVDTIYKGDVVKEKKYIAVITPSTAAFRTQRAVIHLPGTFTTS